VRVGHRRHPLQLGAAGRLLLEVDQALQRLLISVERLTAGLLGGGQDLLVEFPDPLGGVGDVDSGAGCRPPGPGCVLTRLPGLSRFSEAVVVCRKVTTMTMTLVRRQLRQPDELA